MSTRRKTFTLAEVRAKLYALKAERERLASIHFDPCDAKHRPLTCECCKGWEREITGIEMAIRRFGGRPR